MLFFNCTSCFLVHVFVVLITAFVAHGHGFVTVEWLDGQRSFVAKGEVLDVCKVSAINFPSEDHNEHVLLESATNQPHTTDYIGLDDIYDFPNYEFPDYELPDYELPDLVITTYCKINIIMPPDQNINVTILEADNNEVPSYLYAEKHCFNPPCFDR